LLSLNQSIFEIDYEFYKNKCSIFKEELMRKVLHPDRWVKYMRLNYNICTEEEDFTFSEE
jgi:hypothetical protein